MKIACVGWGSLIWDPRELKIKDKKWFKDGPILPVEFVRISGNKRVTLVVDPTAKPLTTLWNLMDTNNFQIAFDSILQREGTITKRIHSIDRKSTPDSEIEKTVQSWLIEKELDSAIWTGLYLNNKVQDSRPTADEIIGHLKSLSTTELEKAKEYIMKTPEQINTNYRKEIMNTLNW
jgi:hypothetical protein